MKLLSLIERAKELLALSEKATPGPWNEHTSFPYNKPSMEVASIPAKKSICDMTYGSGYDREFIAASRNLTPELCRAVIEMDAHITELKNVLQVYASIAPFKVALSTTPNAEFQIDGEAARTVLAKYRGDEKE